jgi:hypothetical protein
MLTSGQSVQAKHINSNAIDDIFPAFATVQSSQALQQKKKFAIIIKVVFRQQQFTDL